MIDLTDCGSPSDNSNDYQSGDPCIHTNEDGAEEESDGDVDNRRWHVQEPVGSHGKESQEEQKEEQTVLVLLNLEDKGEMLNDMYQSTKGQKMWLSFLSVGGCHGPWFTSSQCGESSSMRPLSEKAPSIFFQSTQSVLSGSVECF